MISHDSKKKYICKQGLLIYYVFLPNPGYRKNIRLFKGQCTNVDETWNDKASSIDPKESCVLVWQNHGCSGRVVRLQKYRFGTERLSLVNMNDEISSLSLC